MDCKSCDRRKGSAACDECGWWGNYRRAHNSNVFGTSPNTQKLSLFDRFLRWLGCRPLTKDEIAALPPYGCDDVTGQT